MKTIAMDIFKKKLSEYADDPATCNFLEKLSKKLGPDFLRERVRKEMFQIQGNLNESIQKYFKYYIIMEAACKASYEDLDNSLNPFSFKMILPYFRNMKSSKEANLFDLKDSYISEILENQKAQWKGKEFLHQIENNIQIYLKMLSDCSEETQNNSAPKSKSYNAFEEMLKHFSSKAKYLNFDNELYLEQPMEEMLHTYYMKLKEGLSLMMETLNWFKCSLQFKSDLAEWYSLNCSTLLLKMNVFEAEVMSDTYTSDSVAALKIIKNDLDARMAEIKNEKASKSSHLQAYSVLGPEYEKLVTEYTELVEAVQKQQWAVDTLKSQK